MSITNLTRSLVLALAVLGLMVPRVGAQQTFHPHNHTVNPFIDPLDFNPDFQWFAPADLGEFGQPPDPNTGWFGAFNRMYYWVPRPETEASYTDGDFTWGNRVDIGYMTDENHGWWVSGIHVDGPQAFLTLIQPRINRYNPDDTTTDDDVTEVFPVQDRNDIYTGARDIFLRQSLNVANISGFEINRTWRLDRLHYGGVLEPLIGFRFLQFRDYTQRSGYQRFDDTGVTNPFPNDTDVIEEITSSLSQWRNDMVGGQFGIRWSGQHNHWKLSSDWRIFAFNNFQNYQNIFDTYQILYDGVGDGSAITTEKYTQRVVYTHDAHFVYGTEVRTEAAFELTRDIAIMGGLQYLGMFQGIARGNRFSPGDLNQEVHTFGITFGASLNR